MLNQKSDYILFFKILNFFLLSNKVTSTLDVDLDLVGSNMMIYEKYNFYKLRHNL